MDKKCLLGTLLACFLAPSVLLIIDYSIVRPMYDRNRLVEDERFLEKKEIFSKSIQLVYKQFLAGPITNAPDHVPTYLYPTTSEMNDVLSRLYLVSANKDIPLKFIALLGLKDNANTPQSVMDYIMMLREELYGNSGGLASSSPSMFLNQIR